MSYWALLLLELIDIVFIHQAIRFIEITIAYMKVRRHQKLQTALVE